MTGTEPSVAQLLATVEALAARVAVLEKELAIVQEAVPDKELPEEVVVAISAAVAAFLGHRAKVKQIHYRGGTAWTQQGRVAVQGHNIRGR